MNEISIICGTCLSADRKLMPLNKIKAKIMFINLYEIIPEAYICWECQSVINKFYKFKLKAGEAQRILQTTKKVHKTLSKLNTASTNNFNYEFQFDYDPLITYPDQRNNIKTENNEDSNQTIKDINTISRDTKMTDVDTSNIDIDATSIDRDRKSVDLDTIIDIERPLITDITDIKIEPLKKIKCKRKRKDTARKDKNMTNTGKDICNDLTLNYSFPKETDKEMSEVNYVKEWQNRFEVINYKESELEKIREDKRSQPNFKKLPYKCDSCVVGFMSKDKYDSHIIKRHNKDIGEHVCSVCLIRLPHKQSLKKHENKHFIAYRCRLCAYVTSELWSAVRHDKAKHKNDSADRIHCTVCQVVAKSKDELKLHMEVKHVVYCNACGEKFKGKSTLRTHMRRVHSTNRQYTCDICTKTFVRKSRLESHMARHDDTLAKKMAYCTICNMQYKNIFVYRNHLKSTANHTERLYCCPDCSKKFVSKSYMRQHHNFYHLRKSSYKCDTCNKLFMTKWRLENHKQKHHGLSRPRNHACKICSKKFYTSTSLRGHELIHNSQRGYMCEECGDTFKQPAALYTHNKLVHKTNRK